MTIIIWNSTSNNKKLSCNSQSFILHTQPTQTSLRRLQDVLKRSRRLTTKQDVLTTSGKRRQIYNILRKSDLRRLEEDQFATSWKRLIYDVLKTSAKRYLCSNVIVTSIQRWKKWFFLILYCLKYLENFKCSSLSWYIGMGFCTNQWNGLYMRRTSVMRELTTFNNKFYRIRGEERE